MRIRAIIDTTLGGTGFAVPERRHPGEVTLHPAEITLRLHVPEPPGHDPRGPPTDNSAGATTGARDRPATLGRPRRDPRPERPAAGRRTGAGSGRGAPAGALSHTGIFRRR